MNAPGEAAPTGDSGKTVSDRSVERPDDHSPGVSEPDEIADLLARVPADATV